jgi:hypothetical protein
MAHAVSLARCEPGSLDELLAIRRALIRQFGEATPSSVAQITAKLLDVSDRIKTARDTGRTPDVGVRPSTPDEPFDPSEV